MTDRKIVPFQDISSQVESLRAASPGTPVILCHGCFDIVHPGHIRHLKFAKEQGGFLVVSITPDVCMQKGSSRPFMPQDLRAENLAALEIIDVVVIAPAETGLESIKAIRPDIYIKGNEYAVSLDPRFIKEKELVESLGGRVVYSSGEVVFSSSELIRDHEMDLALAEKLNYICKRYGISRSLLSGSLDNARTKEILVVGEAILEERLYCEGIGISQESPVLSIAQRHRSLSVGGAGAVAQHLAASGMKVSFLTSTHSSGQPYEFFKLAMEESSVGLFNIDDKFRQVCVKAHYFVDRNQVMEVERGSHRPLDSALKTSIMKKFKDMIASEPGAVLFSDYGYGLLSNDLVAEMRKAASAKGGILTIADISMTPRTNLDKFSSCDIFNATEAELRSCMHDYESGLSVLVDSFYADYSVAELYLLLSDGGALYFRPSQGRGRHQSMESIHIPQLLPRREGRTGLPEAFLSGLALARCSGLEQEASTYMAAVFSAVQSRGGHSARSIDISRLRQLLSERKELD